MVTDLPYKFEPRFYQDEITRAIFVAKKRRILEILHRRAGKSIGNLNLLTGLAFRRKGLYLYTFPEFKQARRNIWNGLDKDGRRYLDYIPTNLVKRFDKQEMSIEFINGSILQLAGTDNYDSFLGSNPVGIVYDEYATQDPMARLLLEPVLVENNGIEIFSYTPRGRNHGHKLYLMARDNPEDWHVSLYGIDKTKRIDGSPVISAAEVEKQVKNGYPRELANQEYYCSFEAGQLGSYYSTYIQSAEENGRIADFRIEPKLPVYTWCDLGIADDMGIAFVQALGHEIRFIHYFRGSGEGLRYYYDEIVRFQKEHHINYGAHYAPHDISVRELSTGKTRLQSALEMGWQFQIVPSIPIQDGIDLARRWLPQCYFHKTNCSYLIDSIRDYHKEFDSKSDCFKPRPKHDWSSHGADVFRYFAVTWNDWFGDPKSNSGTTRPSRYR